MSERVCVCAYAIVYERERERERERSSWKQGELGGGGVRRNILLVLDQYKIKYQIDAAKTNDAATAILANSTSLFIPETLATASTQLASVQYIHTALSYRLHRPTQAQPTNNNNTQTKAG